MARQFSRFGAAHIPHTTGSWGSERFFFDTLCCTGRISFRVAVEKSISSTALLAARRAADRIHDSIIYDTMTIVGIVG